MNKAIVFLADGFEECEALLVVDLLRRAGVQTIMASVIGRLEVPSSRKILIKAEFDIVDMCLDRWKCQDMASNCAER